MCFPSSLDKALHSAGISSGFIIFGTNLTNPLNELLLVLQPVSLSSSHAVKRWFCLIKTHLKPYFLTSIIINPHELQRSSILCCPMMHRWLCFNTGQKNSNNVCNECDCVIVLQKSAQMCLREGGGESGWWLVRASESPRGHQPPWLALSIIRPSSVAERTWLLLLSQVFPLDYILITVITVYFVITSMAGIRHMGIWFFWIRVSNSSTSAVPGKD